MLGDALLAAPVVPPGRARSATSTCPPVAGTTGGPARPTTARPTSSVDAPLDRLPLFGRAGTVVPTADGSRRRHGRRLRHHAPRVPGRRRRARSTTTTARRSSTATGPSPTGAIEVRSHGAEVIGRLSAIDGDFAPTRRLVFVTPAGRTSEVIDTGGPVEVSLPT